MKIYQVRSCDTDIQMLALLLGTRKCVGPISRWAKLYIPYDILLIHTPFPPVSSLDFVHADVHRLYAIRRGEVRADVHLGERDSQVHASLSNGLTWAPMQ
jgi:hypothetical protein